MPDVATRTVFAALLSLSIYGLSNHLIDHLTKKCPWDTQKTKLVVLVIIAIVSLIVLFYREHRLQKTKISGFQAMAHAVTDSF
jgi:F0F1-type ATP synthase membrane subunit a